MEKSTNIQKIYNRIIVGPPLQGRLEVLHSHTVVWLDKSSERPPSSLQPNDPKTE